MTNQPPNAVSNLKNEFMSKSRKTKYFLGASALVILPGAAVLTTIALQVVTNLAIIGGICLGGLALYSAMPTLLRKWKNKLIEIDIREAARRPIETLKRQLSEKYQRLENIKQLFREIKSKYLGLKDSIENFERKFGEKDADLLAFYDKLTPLVTLLSDKIKVTSEGLADMDLGIQKAEEKFEIAQSMGNLADLLRSTTGGDPMEAFLERSALKSIQSKVNLSFVELDEILAEESIADIQTRNIKQVEHKPAITIDALAQEVAPVERRARK